MAFAGRHVVLGVSGGIACYKSCTLARRLNRGRSDGGCGCSPRPPPSSCGRSTFEALTGRPVLTSLWQRDRALAPRRAVRASRTS